VKTVSNDIKALVKEYEALKLAHVMNRGMDGASATEIAEELAKLFPYGAGVSQSTVSRMLDEAREKLNLRHKDSKKDESSGDSPKSKKQSKTSSTVVYPPQPQTSPSPSLHGRGDGQPGPGPEKTAGTGTSASTATAPPLASTPTSASAKSGLAARVAQGLAGSAVHEKTDGSTRSDARDADSSPDRGTPRVPRLLYVPDLGGSLKITPYDYWRGHCAQLSECVALLLQN
jgi:hypothetical protein